MIVAADSGKKATEVLDLAPFYLEKTLNYLKDKYFQYFTIK